MDAPAMATPAVSTQDDDLFADARKRMVDSQLRPNKVTDPRILEAMRRIPRERFLPAPLASLAYADEDVPLGGGRVLMEPMVLARLLQLAAPLPGERALVIAAGCGYGAAVLAATGARVTALEEIPALTASAAMAAEAPGVNLVSGPLSAGWPAAGPYDLIVIEGAVPEVPAAIASQLKADGGRLAAVIRTGGTSQAVLAEVSASGLRTRPAFDCSTPLLPSLCREAAFSF
jgi:protein-L-isoaspartate(D-aspartate) O-methyltransferase